MIACEEKYAALAGAERMLQIVVAQRLPGDDQSYRVQLRGVTRNSALRIGWVQLASATATSNLRLPGDLLCAVRRVDIQDELRTSGDVSIQAKLVAAQKLVTYVWERPGSSQLEEQLLATPLADDVDVSKLFLAAILYAPGDAAYLLPSEAGYSWAPQFVVQPR